MKILVTGGNGFIGRSLIKVLKLEHKVFSPSRTDLDLTDSEAVEKYFLNKYFDSVIHCAITGGRRTENDTKDVLSDNILMFFNLMRNKMKFKSFINFSSGAELDRSINMKEAKNNPNKFFPKDYYGISKNIISRLIYNDKQFFNLRLYGVFGSEEGSDRFISRCIRKIKSGKKIEIFQDKQFDFFYIDDLVLLVLKILNSNQSLKSNELDLVYKHKYTLSDIGKLLLHKLNSSNGILIKDKHIGLSYIGSYDSFFDNIEFKGLEYGIDCMIKNAKSID